MLATVFVLYVVASLFYISRLHARLRSYENLWQQIEEIADKDEDGKYFLNVQHVEEHPNPFEAHANDIPSGVQLISLDGDKEKDNQVA